MIKIPIDVNITAFPEQFHDLLANAKLYDSSCSKNARVIFVDKDSGYFIKSAAIGKLKAEAEATNYFNRKGLAENVIQYLSIEQDWLLTECIKGDDCLAPQYLANPKRLCERLAEILYNLHNTDCSDCKIVHNITNYVALVQRRFTDGNYDDSFVKYTGFENAEFALSELDSSAHIFHEDTLTHGDFCLPNIILNDWKFSGFVDLDFGGICDRHRDLFWAVWTLRYNFRTDEYRDYFLDSYGRANVDENRFLLWGALEL